MKIDINKLKDIETELNSLGEDDVLEVNDGDDQLYVIMKTAAYDKYLQYAQICQGGNYIRVEPQIKVLNKDDMELSYEDYEKIKKQLMDIFDQTFKPKPERMN